MPRTKEGLERAAWEAGRALIETDHLLLGKAGRAWRARRRDSARAERDPDAVRASVRATRTGKLKGSAWSASSLLRQHHWDLDDNRR
jgi:hypothetical protein